MSMLADAATVDYRDDFIASSLNLPEDQSPDLAYLVTMMYMAGMCEAPTLR